LTSYRGQPDFEQGRPVTKLLTKPFFVQPIGAAIIVSAIALALSFTSWLRIGLTLLGFALVAPWVAGHAFVRQLAKLVAGISISAGQSRDAAATDAVILLGGAGLDLNNPNRIMHALQIYRAGKAPQRVEDEKCLAEVKRVAAC
jgi:hypothetical protein